MPTRRALSGCLLVIPLAVGCSSLDDAANTIPATCEDGQILTLTLGRWECGWPPRLSVPSPNPPCIDPKYGMLRPGWALTSDGKNLGCENLDRGLGYSLQQASSEADRLSQIAAYYDPAKAPLPSRFRGVTAVRSTALMKAAGVDNGLPAAAAICAAEYAGSHLCSMLEMYDSVARGAVTRDQRIPKSWIYFPAGNASATAMQPTEGLADSCAGYTYERDDRGWSGIAVEWTVLPTGFVGLKFHGGTSAMCSASLPLACCGGA